MLKWNKCLILEQWNKTIYTYTHIPYDDDTRNAKPFIHFLNYHPKSK